MNLLMLCLLAVLFGASADYFIKVAIQKDQLLYMIFPMISWGIICPIIWYLIYKDYTITKALAVFHPTTMIILTLIGIILFKEPITFKLCLALILSISAILLVEL